MARIRAKIKKESGGRGSPEAIAKRRAARTLNTLFGENGSTGRALDGRTEKRRVRLIKELSEGRGGRPLKAIEVLTHTNELLDLGETVGSIRKSGAKPLRIPLTDGHMRIVEQTQQEYGFRPEAWQMLGVELRGEGGGRGRRKMA